MREPNVKPAPNERQACDGLKGATMTRVEALSTLISVRHHCFARGIIGKRRRDRTEDKPPEDDFRQAFRTLNRLYIEVDGSLEWHSGTTRRAPHGGGQQRRTAA
jgi:hypothetical protein